MSTFPTPQKKSSVTHKWHLFAQLAAALLLIAAALLIARYFILTSPKAEPKKPSPRLPLVRVEEVVTSSGTHFVEAMGTVVGEKEIDLFAKVSGEVVSISPELLPGGYFPELTPILQLDRRDYEYLKRQRESELAKASADLVLEMGNQRIARREFELLGETASEAERDLMLRQPQLDIAKASLEAAEARLAAARLDLQRTRIIAPFNAVVIEKKVTLGSLVSPTTPLARLAGTDTFWIKATLPREKLTWLQLAQNKKGPGSSARIYPGQGLDTAFRKAEILRLAPSLETKGRLAVVYLAVDDPLSLLPENRELPQLLLGSFVKAVITGVEYEDQIVIDRDHLRPGDTVWVLSDDETLEIRQVEVAARTEDKIFIAEGLQEKERLIVSNLASAVSGTRVRVEDGQEDSKPGKKGQARPAAHGKSEQ